MPTRKPYQSNKLTSWLIPSPPLKLEGSDTRARASSPWPSSCPSSSTRSDDSERRSSSGTASSTRSDGSERRSSSGTASPHVIDLTFSDDERSASGTSEIAKKKKSSKDATGSGSGSAGASATSLKRKRADDGKKKDNDEDDKDDERRTAQSYYQQQIDLKTDATTNANQPMADEAIFRTRFDHIYEKIKSQNLPQVWRSLFLDVDTFTSSKHNGVSNDDNNDDDDDDDNGRFGRNYWYSTFLESLHPKAEAILSARTAPKYEDLKAIGTSSSGINTFAVYWKGAKTRSESGKQLSYIGSATNATCANPMATRMGQHLAKANQPDKEHSSPFDQIVSTANGEYTLSFATLLTVPVHMVDDVIASCIRILFAEAVISSWLDCYDVNHRSSLISYNAGFWVDGSSPQLHGTLTHSALREGVRGLGVVDDEAARSTMDEHRKAYRQAARRRKYGHRDETEDEKRVRIANGGETDEQRAERKELKRIREKRSRHAARDAYLKQHPPKPRSPMETKRANYERKQAEREALDPQLRIDRLAKAAKKKRERRAERERLNPQLHVDRLAKEAQRYREVQAAKNSSS